MARLWTRECPFERQLITCYQTLVETASLEGQKIILRTEMDIISWVVLEKNDLRERAVPRRVL